MTHFEVIQTLTILLRGIRFELNVIYENAAIIVTLSGNIVIFDTAWGSDVELPNRIAPFIVGIFDQRFDHLSL